MAERAGDRALAASALDRARDQYGAALKALDATAPLSPAAERHWVRVVHKLGSACVFDPLAPATAAQGRKSCRMKVAPQLSQLP